MSHYTICLPYALGWCDEVVMEIPFWPLIMTEIPTQYDSVGSKSHLQ
jgi:hypothetical protein